MWREQTVDDRERTGMLGQQGSAGSLGAHSFRMDVESGEITAIPPQVACQQRDPCNRRVRADFATDGAARRR